MDDLLIVGKTQGNASFYLSELSSFTLEENGLSGAPAGLYLYEETEGDFSSGIRVLAQVHDIASAYRLLEMMTGATVKPASYRVLA